ncbi:hypothetical protein PLICRDRAFT_86077 [Plicaturopsis crispa FD-325 SS-3]|nr:hypothetical protein PLICRDRAFT_86077 [Plicaturopsis crispa FD-325 SS-3]
MATDPPLSLSLSDIMHLASPSPAAADLADRPRTRSASPDLEPLDADEVQAIRRRVVQMNLAKSSSAPSNSREKELADMVMKLTSTIASQPSHNQVVHQASTIAALTSQRNFLIQEGDAQRARWESEKEGWERMAEALIAQRGKVVVGNKDEESDRHMSLHELDNKTLKQKLTESQARLHLLEAELSKLRPLLLMAPTHTSTHSRHHRSSRPLITIDERSNDDLGDDTAVAGSSTGAGTKQHQSNISRRGSQVKAAMASQARKQMHAQRGSPLLSDARAEHLLLAARKIGRERAGWIATTKERRRERKREEERARKELEKERERERERAAQMQTQSPKTPRRLQSQQQSSGYMYTYSPGQPMLVPGYQNTPQAQGSSAQAQGQATPLDSLLSAARSMEHVPGGGGRKGRPIDAPDTPVPKRRKLGSGDTALDVGTSANGSGSGTGRMRSALDVLADQAAAFSSTTPKASAAATSKKRAKAKGKGKGKQKEKEKEKEQSAAVDDNDEPDNDTPRPSSPGPSALPPKARERRLHQKRDQPPGEHDANSSFTSFRGEWGTGPPRLAPVSVWGTEPTPAVPDSSSPIRPAATADETVQGTPLQTDDAADVNGTETVATGSAARDDIDMASPPPPQTTPHFDRETTPIVLKPDGAGTPPQPSPSSTLSVFCTPPSITTAEDTVSPHSSSFSLAPPIPSLRSQSEHIPNDAEDSTTARSVNGLSRRASSIPLESTQMNTGEYDLSAHARHDTEPMPSTSTPAGTPQSQASLSDGDARRARSPYVKWSKEEDDMLTQAVAKHGQKWDVVQKALPSRGYHQVRQRWLRKLGVFDSKPDLSSFQTGGSRGSDGSGPVSESGTFSDPPPNPKLGLAPLSSELAFAPSTPGASQ